MKPLRLWVSLFAAMLALGACAPVEFAPPEPLYLQVDLPPPPVPDAKVEMTNSKGETVFQGVTDRYGRAQGTNGPGTMDNILNVTVTLPDGRVIEKTIDIWPGSFLEYIHVNSLNGEFSTRFRYPQADNRSSDKSEERH